MISLVWRRKAIKNLKFGSIRISGRNNSGKITRYHRGGGSKRAIRLVDFKRYI